MTQQTKEKVKQNGVMVTLVIFAVTTLFWVGYTYASVAGMVEWRVTTADPKLEKIEILDTKVSILTNEIMELRKQIEKFNDNIKDFYKTYDMNKIKKGNQ